MRKSSEPGQAPSLREKLFLYFLLFSLVILVLLSACQVLFMDRFYLFITEKRLREASELLASAPEDKIEEAADKISDKNSACLSVYVIAENRATVLAEKDTDIGCAIHSISARQLNELYQRVSERPDDTYVTRYLLYDAGVYRFAWDSVKGERDDAALIGERLVVSRMATTTDGRTIFMLFDCPYAPSAATVHVLRVQLAVLSLSMVAVSALLAFLISRRVSRPLSYLNTAARRLPAGNYPQDYRENAYREVAELSETLAKSAEEIGKVDRLQKELIANISHDLRTPLTMISGYAELIRDIPGENKPENMQIIINEVHRLSSMVEDLVSITRVQGGAEHRELSRFSLSELAEELVTGYRELTALSGYTFPAEITPGLFVAADRKQISAVIRNLVNNAVNYSGEDKTVILRLFTPSAGRIRLEVEDHGIGIEEEELPHIFERYYRSESNHVRSIVGSGLGLSIVRSVLDAHHAAYGVNSRPGEGSVFWFELEEAAEPKTDTTE